MSGRRNLAAVGAVWLTAIAVAGGLTAAALATMGDPAPLLRYDTLQLRSAVPTAAAATAPAPVTSPARSSGIVIDPSWLARVAGATGVPATAVRAYATASVRLAAEEPGCGLGWTTLAAIGQVESVHGTLGGRTLESDGRSNPRIIGPALDGRGEVAAIRTDRAATAAHGDAVWDHAVGPMQFLSSTWTTWGGDGDADGTSDPMDLDDAAYGAGRYLCADGQDLSDGGGWSAAVFSYNHAQSYVDLVYSYASRYAAATA